VRHGDQAEDVVQEAVRAVLARSAAGATSFETPEHARNYFLRAVHSRALDVLRGSERERVQPAEDADVPEENPSSAFEELEARALRAERARHALEGLRPAEREAVRLRYLEGLAFREIAARTGVSISTLHSRVEAGLGRLRERLAEG
jgi:RNA polymerase sigma factor (sigma-70 family)